MLRIRKNNLGNYLFDLWVVGFTAIVVIMYVQLRHVTHNNRALITQVARFSKQTDFKICIRINNINSVTTGSLIRSKRNLPKLSYFKEHPDELKDQIEQIDRQIERFKPRECIRKEVR